MVEDAIEGGGRDHLVADDVPHWVMVWLVVMSLLPRS